jgi:hypothetical protein
VVQNHKKARPYLKNNQSKMGWQHGSSSRVKSPDEFKLPIPPENQTNKQNKHRQMKKNCVKLPSGYVYEVYMKHK